MTEQEREQWAKNAPSCFVKCPICRKDVFKYSMVGVSNEITCDESHIFVMCVECYHKNYDKT